MASALIESLKTLLRGLYRTYAPPSYTGVELLRSDGQTVDAVEPVGEHPSEIPEWQAALIAEFCAEAGATGGEPAISAHDQLDHLDYESSGHLGFASAVDLADHVGSSSGVHGSTSTPTASAIPQATVLGKLDGWISDAAAGAKGLLQLAGALGGTAASPKVVGITETDGPTDLTFGDILDGEFLKRDGMTIVGAAAGGGGGGGGAESKEGLNITATVNAGDSLEINLTSMFNRGLISRVRISANSATLLTMVRFYGKDTFLAADLQYEAGDFDAYTTAWEDRNCWHYQDDDSSDEVHVKIYNHGTVNSTYIIYVVGIGE